MALPKLNNTPKYELTVPSSGEVIRHRPFLVKEEKVLMIAQESKDEKQILKSIKEIISACSFGKLNPNDCTTIDLEYVFLQLRAKSVGETVTVKIKCEKCDTYASVIINLEDIQVSEAKKVDNNIQITDSIGVILKKILIAGCAGYIGTRFCEEYDDKYDITVLDPFWFGDHIKSNKISQ